MLRSLSWLCRARWPGRSRSQPRRPTRALAGTRARANGGRTLVRAILRPRHHPGFLPPRPPGDIRTHDRAMAKRPRRKKREVAPATSLTAGQRRALAGLSEAHLLDGVYLAGGAASRTISTTGARTTWICSRSSRNWTWPRCGTRPSRRLARKRCRSRMRRSSSASAKLLCALSVPGSGTFGPGSRTRADCQPA